MRHEGSKQYLGYSTKTATEETVNKADGTRGWTKMLRVLSCRT